MRRYPSGDFLVGLGTDDDTYLSIWDVYAFVDNLKVAEWVLDAYLRIWSRTRNVFFIANLYISYGKLMYEWNRLEEADRYFNQALGIDKTYHNPNLIYGWLEFIRRKAGKVRRKRSFNRWRIKSMATNILISPEKSHGGSSATIGGELN